MLCYVISHVPGVLKGFQDQTVLFSIHSLCFDLAGEKSIVGLWQEALLSPSTFPHAQRPQPQGFWGGLRSCARHSHIYCASSSEGSKPFCTNQTLLTAVSLQHKP